MMADYFTKDHLEQVIQKSTMEITQRVQQQSPASPDPVDNASDNPYIISDEPDHQKLCRTTQSCIQIAMANQLHHFAGIPLAVGSLRRQFDPYPLLPHHEGNENKYVSMSRLRMPIRWESLFVLPNLESRIVLYFAEIESDAVAMQMSPLKFVRPIEARISHLIRTYEPPETWDMQSIHQWCQDQNADVDVDDMIAWAHTQGIQIMAGHKM